MTEPAVLTEELRVMARLVVRTHPDYFTPHVNGPQSGGASHVSESALQSGGQEQGRS